MTTFGRKLNPYRCLREPLGVKGIRQSIVITNNPSTIDQNEQLLVRFPNLTQNDLIIPGTARLAFTIALTSTDDNRRVVQNLGRAIIKKIIIKISGNEVMSIDDSDIYHIYSDLWKTASERTNLVYQGIDESKSLNVTKLRIGAADGNDSKLPDKAIADTFGTRYYIPLDFELLETHMPYYQSGLGDRLEYELTFNEYSRVIIATGDPNANYEINNISLEFDMVTETNLATMVRNQYEGKMSILYDRILRHRKIVKNKSDEVWNINLNTPARSVKGILMIFEEPAAPFTRDSERFYNPKINKVEITIEGIPNQLYAQGMKAYQMWDEVQKQFAGGNKNHPNVDIISKDLCLSDVTIGEYLTSKYALWLDLRTTDDNSLHGNGRRILNASEGITIQISKAVESAGTINIYLFLIQDAQLNIEDGRYVSAFY
jgi:hypothetical protein